MTEDYNDAEYAYTKYFRTFLYLGMYEALDLMLYNVDYTRDILYTRSLLTTTISLHHNGHITEWMNARNKINTELVSKKQWTMFEWLDEQGPELKFHEKPNV